MSDLIGKTIGQYEIVEKIGVGGMATVFKAYQASINRYVAVKVLPTQFAHDSNFVKRFTQEAKAIAALEHPHILPVYDFGTDEGLTYMVMRYVEGGTLADMMGQPMSNEQLVQIVGNVARALEYAHSQGVVHRDIKPSNVLIDQHGEVLLTDFGIAKMMQESGGTQLTGTGSILGTPEYMSPEQAEGVSVDHRSDIYSLGVVLYELLTGQPPYQAKTPLAVVLKHVKEPLPLPRSINPNVPEPLEQVVVKAMDKNQNKRYQSAAEMEQALKTALKDTESTSPTASMPMPGTQDLPKPASAKSGGMMGPLLIVGLVVVVLLCVGAAAVFGFVTILGDGSTGDATTVSGDVEVAGDLFKTTPTAAPLPETDEPPTVEIVSQTDIVLPAIDLDRPELFRETFDDNQNEWTTDQENDEYGRYIATIGDGKYRMHQDAEKGVFVWEQLPNGEFDNFVAVVDVIPYEANAEAYASGLTFRGALDSGSLYALEIDGDGFFVNFLSDGEWQTLVDFTTSSAINVNGPNQLMVKAVGPVLTFYINGEEVDSIEDDSLHRGSVGMALDVYEAGDSVTVDFDNLTVYALTDDELAALGDTSILFEEYFDSDVNGWATGEFEDEYSMDEITIEDGVYTLSTTAKPGERPFVEKKLPNREFSDFVLIVDATPQDSATNYTYGFSFRLNSDGNGYTLEVDNDGLYVVQLYKNGWETLKDWSGTSAIKAGQTNQLKVVANGSTLEFFVNDEFLTTIEDDTVGAGKISLLVNIYEEGTSAAVDFDNLVIKRVE